MKSTKRPLRSRLVLSIRHRGRANQVINDVLPWLRPNEPLPPPIYEFDDLIMAMFEINRYHNYHAPIRQDANVKPISIYPPALTEK